MIPTRDRKEMAEAAIRSVLEQTRPAAQILVIDDGSAPSYTEYLR
ncbi:MAG: glycosyltransferase family A protein, partial [Vicinamibacteria bacterium]